MTFTNPQALALLLLIPVMGWLAWYYNKPHSFSKGVRFYLQLLVRGLIILLIVLALAGLERVQMADNLATVFVLDVSDSLGQAGQAAGEAYIRQALNTMKSNDLGGIVVFGAQGSVERIPSNNTGWRELASVPAKSYSNLAAGINLALAVMPNNAAKRIVILSDGKENVGDARQAAQVAAASGVELSVIELKNAIVAEVRLVDLDVPSVLHVGEKFDLKVTINSTSAMSVPIQIFSEGQLIVEDVVRVKSGTQTFSVPQVAKQARFPTFKAIISPPQDTFLQNNTLETFTRVDASPQIMVVADRAAEAKPLVEALRSRNWQVVEAKPNELPSDLNRLNEYNSIVLVNVPSFKLAPRQLGLLQTYVRDLGNGLVVVGGDQSYGVGGYFQTPLEETLPVEMTITDKQRLPGMTMIMVIDKSGSMADSGSVAGGPRKVELAKEAIIRSLALLVPWDRVGVVAFDNAAYWVVKPTSINNLQAIKDGVGTIRADGGTDIFAGLKAAADAILQETTQVRHIILLSDGGSDPTGIPELTKKLAEAGVTVSVVAVGEGYAPFLEDVAKVGGGRFYLVTDASVIPQIFAQETSMASRSYIIEENFTPKLNQPSPMLEGLNNQLPPLRGYVATSAKLTAQTILSGGTEDDPLLVQWQYGLGRAVAWTSDAKNQWAADWVGWAEFPRFWSQVVRWTLVEGQTSGVESHIRLEGDQAIVTAELLDSQGRYLNSLTTTLTLVAPDLTTQTVQMAQIAPGLYEGAFQPKDMGTYFLRLTGQQGGQTVAAQTRGFSLAYSPEYRQIESEVSVLSDIAKIGNGHELPLDKPAEAFAHTLPAAPSNEELWPYLILVAALLLPIDVGLRRIIFGREDLRRVWRKLRGQLPEPSLPMPSSVGQLLQIKRPTASKSTPIEPKVKPTISASKTPPPQSTTPTPPPPEDADTVQKLLKAKQRKRR